MYGINIYKKKENYISATEKKQFCWINDSSDKVFLFPAGGPGGWACLPVFIKPKLSGGHHRDDNQAITKQTKPITARRTEPGSLDCAANLDQERGTAARLKALRGQWSPSPPSSVFLSNSSSSSSSSSGGINSFQDRLRLYGLLRAVSGRRCASRWTTRGPPPGPARVSPPPGRMALFGSGELLESDLNRE